MKSKKVANSKTVRSPVSSFSTTRRETSNLDGQIIEMTEMALNDSNSPGVRRLSSKSGEERPNISKKSDFVDDGTSSESTRSSGARSHNELLPQVSTSVVLPADSLELIADGYARKLSECEKPIRPTVRKFSDSNVDSDFGRADIRKPRRIQKLRKVRSAADARSSSFKDQKPVSKKIEIEKLQNFEDQPCCSKSLATEPNTSESFVPTSLHRTLDRLGTEELDAHCIDGDVKGQITKFLEELIEKHPETLDAIENVRMNRLGRPPIVSSLNSEEKDRRRETRYHLHQMGLSDGTHVAYDHSDTTQGAIHSFQDEHGNWFTYAFDERGTGTAQALGSSRAIAEMFGSSSKLSGQHTEGRLSVDVDNLSEPSSRISKGHRRLSHQNPPLPTVVSNSPLEIIEQNADNESDEGKYIMNAPISVFHPNIVSTEPVETGSSRPFISFVNLASRLYNSQLQRSNFRNRSPASSLSAEPPPFSALIDSVPPISSRQSRMALEAFAVESRRRTQNDAERFRWNDYIRMENDNLLAMDGVRQLNFIDELHFCSTQKARSARHHQSKINYYYRLKILPKWMPFFPSQSLKINLNRLSLTALFDRNASWFSSVFDILVAVCVAIFASLLIFRGVYSDFSLFVFAFVVASSQFSLLKSVQPDAASPVHGFNWLVCYSRPAYFCILSVVLLILEWFLSEMDSKFASPTVFSLDSFNWNPRSHSFTHENILVAFRDLTAFILLCLPIFFTFGLLPSVNTLAVHLLEQTEMNVFGGTAAFSLCSAAMAVSRSAIVVSLLSALGYAAFYTDPNSTQNVAFSLFLSVLISSAFVMSRWSSNIEFLRILFVELLPWWHGDKRCLLFQCPESADNSGAAFRAKDQSIVLELDSKKPQEDENLKEKPPLDAEDPLPRLLRNTLALRIHHDLFYITVNSLLVFALHSSSIFTVTQPYLENICFGLCFVFGVLNHHVYPQLRSHTPWKILAKPVLRPFEFHQFESTVQARLMGFERLHTWARIFERSILYPVLICSLMSRHLWQTSIWKVPLATLFGFRISRQAFSTPQLLYLPLGFTFLAKTFGVGFVDLSNVSSLTLFYLFALIWPKVREFVLKMNFILVYIAPWQISWGSAFHAFAQPFSVPHSGLICAQAFISSIISAPLNPFLGSSFFCLSYVRPVRFWERHYDTKRVDNSNLRLVSQLDRGPMVDDSSLNSIFYEHLTRSLQQSLAGDLLLGRWASSIEPGDCFILVSLYLSCMVHIIEVGNDFVTFQVRGLEFRGTYCHQRESEAISEDWTDAGGCCCCSLSNLPGALSCNQAWSLRWLAWEVTAGRYIVDGYSITDNSAVNLLQVHELRRLLVTLYVKCIIFYALRSPSLQKWLSNAVILNALEPIRKNSRYCDNDQVFCAANDEDYDIRVMALSRQRFLELYSSWISHCLGERLKEDVTATNIAESGSLLSSFCFALTVLGRRALGSAAYNRHANAAESFLYGLHSLFKGDMRVGSSADEWVFEDPEILTSVISPAVRMALKLHQDHFAALDDFDDQTLLFQRIHHYQTNIFISHEHDPAWRRAVIANTPSLLALRHMYDENQDDYKVIMLNKMHLNMRVIKLNRECVRAFWAGQQQELIFLRNRNPERGSIQNARQVLRNMINSSADQPIGYPIYVSPLTTSFVETHDQIAKVVGNPVTFPSIWSRVRLLFGQLRRHFGTSGSSNLASHNVPNPQIINVSQSTPIRLRSPKRTSLTNTSVETGIPDPSFSSAHAVSLTIRTNENAEEALVHRRSKSDATSVRPLRNEPISRLTMTPPLQKNRWGSTHSDSHGINSLAMIIDKTRVQMRLNEPVRSTGEFLVVWPREVWRSLGGRDSWPKDFNPQNGIIGRIVHEWSSVHSNRSDRSHSGRVYLLAIAHHTKTIFLPVLEDGIKFIDAKRTDDKSSCFDTETNI